MSHSCALHCRGGTVTDRDAWTIDPRCGWFAPPGSPPVVIGAHSPAGRLLSALAEQRVRREGEGMTLDELIEAGWPGTRIQRQAARNRLHVALTALRNKGLRSVLLRSSRRYLLDPRVPVRVLGDT
jgi:hypothetical protein